MNRIDAIIGTCLVAGLALIVVILMWVEHVGETR